jgi:hypothetical protein
MHPHTLTHLTRLTPPTQAHAQKVNPAAQKAIHEKLLREQKGAKEDIDEEVHNAVVQKLLGEVTKIRFKFISGTDLPGMGVSG